MNYDIVISGTIGSWDCLSTSYVRYLLDQKKDKDVHVAFCSLGGYVMDGLVLNQLFHDHGKVHAHAFGMNASISTIAMLGCADIDIVRGSFFLIHNTSTVIMKYSQANKEELDEYIKNITKQRNDLATLDDVLAQMYADKSGKSKEECAAQMKKGNWLNAEEAVDFGLVDKIREDPEDEKKASDYKNMFLNAYKNNIIKDSGIPPLPTDNAPINEVVDEQGNPTQTFLHKALQGVRNLFLSNSNAEDKKEMSKPELEAHASALAVDSLPVDEKGQVILTPDQAKTLNEKLAEKAEDKQPSQQPAAPEANADDELNKVKDELDKAKKDLAAKDEQIKNLQKGPGESTNDIPQNKGGFTDNELWDSIKNV